MHSKLSSFMRPKRKPKVEHSNDVFPFPIPPPPPAPDVEVLVSSPHPYSSAEVLDISPDTRSDSSFDDAQPSETLINPYSPASPLFKQHKDNKPSIQLDLDFGLKTLSELVPSHLLDSENAATHADVAQKDPEVVFLDDGGDESASEDSMVQRLTSMNASDFMNTQEQSESSQSRPSKTKRSPPAPLRINKKPISATVAKLTRQASQPNTASSLGELSTISGTTFARALIANTYAFSVESETSPLYRGTMTRADSATLPSTDSPFATLPPADMPPVPSDAEAVYVPPLVSREEDVSQKTTKSIHPEEPIPSPPAMPSPGMSDVLSYYEGSTDREKSAGLVSGFKPTFTPITEESSQPSPSSPFSGKVAQKELPSGYKSQSGASAPVNRADFRRPSHSRREASIDGQTSRLFPIGARAASISAKPGAFSTEMSRPASPPASAGPSSLPPLARPVFNRERSGTTPSPIQVVRDPKDPRQYYLTATSDIGGDSPRNSIEIDQGKQTFPETAVSPTWSSSVHGNRGAASPRNSLDRSRFPQTPSSETGGHVSLAQQIMRTTSPPIRGVAATQALELPASEPLSAVAQSQESGSIMSSPGNPSPLSNKATSPGNSNRPSHSATANAFVESLERNPATPSAPYSPAPPPYEVAISPRQSPTPNESAQAAMPSTVSRHERAATIAASGHTRRVSSIGGPRPRPLPSGPRRPSVLATAPPRARQASEPSNVGQSSSRSLSSDFTTYPTPLFLPPECRWKGHTLDAAVWTFTSETLQKIVAQAIRQSASGSRIRLLSPDILEEELPNEIQSLEKKQLLLKTEYQVMCQRRATALRELTAHAEVESGPSNLRKLDIVVKEVKDTCISMDKLAEELHSADEQLTQLRLLQEVHSTSALAMALRKLNSSLLREVAEHQSLKDHVVALEVEREEAWAQAQAIASELDDLQSTSLLSVSPRNSMTGSSRRSSRVQLKRVASERASKAGLRSQRSSMHSNIQRASAGSVPRSRLSVDGASIPPVPLLRAGSHNTTTRRSSRALSLDGGGSTSPISDSQGNIQAQEELLEILGLSLTGEPVVEGNGHDHDRDSTASIARPRSFYGLSKRRNSE